MKTFKELIEAKTTDIKLGKYTFSQGTVVRNTKVIAIEGKGGCLLYTSPSPRDS